MLNFGLGALQALAALLVFMIGVGLLAAVMIAWMDR